MVALASLKPSTEAVAKEASLECADGLAWRPIALRSAAGISQRQMAQFQAERMFFSLSWTDALVTYQL